VSAVFVAKTGETEKRCLVVQMPTPLADKGNYVDINLYNIVPADARGILPLDITDIYTMVYTGANQEIYPAVWKGVSISW